jgi:succinyl-CoA synthetase alpha subunit
MRRTSRCVKTLPVSFILAVYKRMEDAMTKHRDADVLVNFASLRSAYESTIDAMNYPQVMGLWYKIFL